MGTGLAIRWVLKHDILIGSRNKEKAVRIAKKLMNLARGFYQEEILGTITGYVNADAIKEAEVILVAFPPKAVIPALTGLKENFREGQIVISTVVPMKRKNKLYHFNSLGQDDQEKSAAEVIQEILDPIPVVSGFQTVPAAYLNNIDAILNIDVLIAGNDPLALAISAKLIKDIPNLRSLKVGPLSNSKFIEAITPLLINAAILNGLREPSIRIVPWIPT